jgi:hypothetical protein
MKQRTIVLSTGSLDPSLGAGTAHFWVEDLFLPNWGDWKYASGRLESVDLNRVWAVYLHNDGFTDVRIVARED